jgi:transmembrane sensor
MSSDNSHIYDLIAKELASGCSPEEAQVLQQWRDASPANQDEYHQLQQLWQDIKPSATPPRNYNTANAWNKVDNHLRGHDLVPVAGSNTRSLVVKALAAAAVVTLVAGGLWWFTTGRAAHTPQVITANEGKVKSLELEDHSIITLRQGSTITYLPGFNEAHRTVSLQGQAYFEVAPDPAHPFLVETPDHSVVEVLGTAFTVHTSDTSTTVVVSSGKVKLSSDNTPGSLFLVSGERGTTQPGKIWQQPNNDINYLAWKTGILQFNDQPLSEILTQVAGFYGKVIKVENTYQQATTTLKATARFEHESCTETMQELQLLLGFKYREEGDTIIVSQ